MSESTLSTSLALLAALVLVGALAWLSVLRQSAPFHEDEAIYAAWSLEVVQGDPWLLNTPIDKPPLTLYPIALSLALLGESEWVVRLPSLFWMALALAMLWRLAVLRGAAPWLALALALASPLLWAQAGAAFTDPAMVALGLLALERTQRGRATQAGAALALAILAKPTALFLLPLVLAWLGDGGAGARHKPWREVLLGLAVPLLAAWAWDASRSAPSWWVLGQQAYGSFGEGLAAAESWLRALGVTLGVPLAATMLLTRRRDEARESWPRDVLLWTIVAWLPLHAAIGFQPWPRYLLPLVPLAALWLAERRAPRSWAIIAVPLVLLLPLALRPLALAPHDGRWTGIEEIAAAVAALPADATVFYDDAGRPLAWYARDATARLEWIGAGEEARGAAGTTYLLLRDTVPPPPRWELEASAGQFLLWEAR